MPGYWWRRHQFAMLTGGSIILAWPCQLGGAETEGDPAAASGACGRFERADLAWVAS